MSFKTKAFKKAKFEARTESVPLPGMADWFDGEPVWKIRGMDGNALGTAQEMADQNRKTIAAIAEGLASGESESIVSAVRELVGTDGAVPMDVARRIEYMVAGSVEPACDLELAVQMNLAFPIEFRLITNRILTLTGLGHLPGKQKPSGDAPISEPA